MLTPYDNINFSILTELDALEMANIEKQCFSLPWSVQQCKEAFSQVHFNAFGLKEKEHKNTLISYISFYQVLDEVEILNIAVLPDKQNKGFGKHLLINTLQTVSKMDISRVVLEVRPSNVSARALYEGAGFVFVGKRPKYYADTGEDALIYCHTF